MTMLFESLHITDDDPRTLRALFRDAQTNESMRLDQAQISRILDGDFEEVDGVDFPSRELRRGLRELEEYQGLS